jgi:YbbR domain-containing protein
MKLRMKDLVFENLSYKLVSLFIALILWLTILGRRDFTLTKNIEVEMIPGAHQAVISQSVDTVKVKVSGPRTALKKFMDSGIGQLMSVDISRLGAGDLDVQVPIRQIDVPFGVKVISVKPSVIRVRVVDKKE